MIPGLTDRHLSILLGLLVSALSEAGEEGRTGPWVDAVAEILDAMESTPSARSKSAPVGNEPFGTQVTFWSTHWGTRHAIITSSPKPESERERLDGKQWGIALKPDGVGGGMTFAPAEQLTLGWHPDGQ